MKTTEAKVSKGEIDLFKKIQAEPDGVLGKCELLRKRKVKRKIAAKDHPGVRAALRNAGGDDAVNWLDRQSADELNSHGAQTGDAAFGPGSHDQKGPPPQGDVNQRELRTKQRRLAEQTKKGFACGPDAGVDELRKIHKRGPTSRLA